MILPNFLVIGAPKAGTTSLYVYLRQHPDIFMPALKEPRFFAFEGTGNRGKYPIQTWEEYVALFAEAGEATAIGEATPHYLIAPGTAERIHAALPGVRLVAALRDPVERSYSVYLMNLRNKNVGAGTGFLEALPRDHNLQQTYHDRLQRYRALFPADQLRILLFEDLVRAPRATVQDLYAFLGVDAGFVPDVSRIANPGGLPRSQLVHAATLNPRLRAAARNLLPPGLTDRLRDLRSRNLRKPQLSAQERETAIGFFREDILRTQDLIGRDLGAWLRVPPG